jgi:hypothetical protein
MFLTPTREAVRSQPSYRFNRLDLVVLAIVAWLGLLNLTMPFLGDQSFFTLGAIEIHQGSLLYRDFWDVKQPGIFYFYALAGRLFGYHELGVHGLELLLWLGFSLGLQRLTARWITTRSIASLSPLFCGGFYYVIASTWDLTQLEAIVGIPLLLSLVLALNAAQRWGRWRPFFWFMAGVCGGLVLLFKLLFLLVLLPLWAWALWVANPRRMFDRSWQGRVRSQLQGAVLLAIGLALPLDLSLGPYVQVGQLDLIYDTFIALPPQIVAQIPNAPLDRLWDSTIWFISRFAPLLLLGSIGAWVGCRRRDRLTVALLLWCGSGLGCVVLQKQAWWHYYYLLLLVPLGLLAVQGLDRLWLMRYELDSSGSQRRSVKPLALVLMVLCMLPASLLARRTVQVSQAGLGPWQSMADRHPEQKRIADWINHPNNLKGEIYVAGDPIHYLLANRSQSTRLNGWALEFFLPAQWMQLRVELQQTHPPYLFIESAYEELMAQKSPKLVDWIHQHYEADPQGNGIWYRERGPHLGASCVGSPHHSCPVR